MGLARPLACSLQWEVLVRGSWGLRWREAGLIDVWGNVGSRLGKALSLTGAYGRATVFQRQARGIALEEPSDWDIRPSGRDSVWN